MAKPPGFFDKVNYIMDWWEDPCDDPWLLFVRPLRPPTGNLVLSLTTFGMADVMRGYMRPTDFGTDVGLSGRKQRSLRHGRRGASARTRKGAAGRRLRNIASLGDDTGNFVGKRLPGASNFRNPVMSTAEGAFWAVDGVL